MDDNTTPNHRPRDIKRIELRSENGPLLGVLLLSPLRLEVKRGPRIFEVDLEQTLRAGAAVIAEVPPGTSAE